MSVSQSKVDYSAMIYARVNSAAEADSLEKQITAVTTTASDDGMQVLGTFADTTSGLTRFDQRPGGAALMSALETSGADAVYCHDVNRISRDPLSVLSTIALLLDRDVVLRIVGTSAPISPTNALIWTAIHQHDRELVAHRLRVGREWKKSQLSGDTEIGG